MKCSKDLLIVLGIFFAVTAMMSGLLVGMIQSVEGKTDFVYEILDSDIAEIKSELKEINSKLDSYFISGGD